MSKFSFGGSVGQWIMLGLGLACAVAAVLGGLYMGFVVCLYGGIVDVIYGIQAVPASAPMIAWGIVKVLCTSLVGWLTFMVGLVFSKFFIHMAE